MSQLTSSSFMELRHASTDHPIHVVVPERRFFAIDGIGAPATIEYALAGAILRGVAQTAWRRSPVRPADRSGSRRSKARPDRPSG